jgi:hypothetical protein
VPAERQQRYSTLDGLCGVAALAVFVISHAYEQRIRDYALDRYYDVPIRQSMTRNSTHSSQSLAEDFISIASIVCRQSRAIGWTAAKAAIARFVLPPLR